MSSREVRHPLLHPEEEDPSVQLEENHPLAGEENVGATKVRLISEAAIHVYTIASLVYKVCTGQPYQLVC